MAPNIDVPARTRSPTRTRSSTCGSSATSTREPDVENVLFVFDRGARLGRDVKTSRAVHDALDGPGDGRAVDVHVKRRHENAHSPDRTPLQIFFHHLDDAAVSGGNDQVGAGGDGAFRVTEKIEHQRRHHQKQRSRDHQSKPE
jgi:hypothetical protein